MFLLWLKQLPRCGNRIPASVPSPARGRSSPANTPVSPQLLCPTEFYMVLYILFHWSGTPVCSQLVFCMHLCVWRCVPDVSVERDVLHIHLLLRCLVLHIVLHIEPKLPVNSICPLNSILHWGKKKAINETILLFNEGYLRKLYICCFIKSLHP